MRFPQTRTSMFTSLALLSVLCLLIVIAPSPSAEAAGDGSFTPHPTTPSFGAERSNDVELGDLDGDGDLDAVVANHFEQAETVWMNDGSGSLTPHPTTPSFGAERSTDVGLGDLDGDGDLDAVVANTEGAAETVWLNNGSGSLTPHPTTPSFGGGDNSRALDLGDLDGDGDLDAVVGDSDAPETVWLNDGTGSFSAHPTMPSFGAGFTQHLALGDLDGDSDLDAVVANYGGEPETVWVNNGTGSFAPHPVTPSFGGGSDSQFVALGDLDGDGDLDAVVANDGFQAETVWVNDATGSFTPHPTTPSFGLQASRHVGLGDLDGDGDLDAVIANYHNEPETVWVNDGTGSFTPHPTTPSFGSGTSQALALGDLDGNGAGDLDAVVANDSFEPETVWVNGSVDVDTDGDGILDEEDNCPATANPDQADADGDGLGNACDTCPLDAANDADGDEVCGNVDNCPANANPGQEDTDGDGIGDACDPCPNTPGTSCPVPTSKDQCKNNGWQSLFRANGTPFKNQGDCVQYFNTGK